VSKIDGLQKKKGGKPHVQLKSKKERWGETGLSIALKNQEGKYKEVISNASIESREVGVCMKAGWGHYKKNGDGGTKKNSSAKGIWVKDRKESGIGTEKK